ncbi:MAG: hypothetical protein ABI905_09715 [Betaproteobacteria bacterium]
MQTRTLRNLIGILVAAALITAYATILLNRNLQPPNPGATLAGATQMLKIAQTEKYQAELKFAESNAEAARLVGNQVKLGRIAGAGDVVELNVREGGVIEYLLDKKDGDGKPLRVIHLPQVGEPAGSTPISWKCYSANWRGVSREWSNCIYDVGAWDRERRHVAALRMDTAKRESDAEESQRWRESENAQRDFERDRARGLREAERTREDEERQVAAIEREAERLRLESERQKRNW